ncbi:MAG: ATP-binding cassette domain-containing protein [Fusobacteriaceae bacterium]|jgi:D-methionine transport system ATP-binding protein|nr:ATP-binding cassette domain-containing protein [Fusobacteriaceae bacterium]
MIRFENVGKIYDANNLKVHACTNISFSIEKGDIFGVIGYSGAGKSTLIRMVNALERPSSGNVIVNNEIINNLKNDDLIKARKNISMIFQNFNLLNSRTVYENVAMPLILNKTPKKDIKKKVNEILEFVELSEKVNVYPSNLSGGQKQRVGIARALATNPTILLCDEPTSALDPRTTESILGLLKKINQELDVTILIITHQMNIVQNLCNKMAVMEEGRIVEIGDVKKIFAKPREAITKTFVNSVIDNKIPDPVLIGLREKKNGKILTVRCMGGNVCDTFVPELRNKFDTEINTLSVSVNEVQNAILTVFSLQITGSDRKIKEVTDYLSNLYEYEEVLL